jgi:F0F1-type ATP synthase delta subunit
MTKKQIKELVLESYKEGELDGKTVEKVAELLTRSQLKQYVATIKKYEDEKSVVISIPALPNKDQEKKLSSLFPKRKIVFDIDPSLLMGMRITDKDLITDVNLKHTLDHLVEHVTENYD